MQNFCFCQLSMQILWRCRCSRVVDLKLPNKSSCEAGVRLSLFSVVLFVAQSHVHLNPGSLSFFGGLVFKRLFSVRDNYLLKIDCSCHKFNYVTLECLIWCLTIIVHSILSFFAQHLSYTFGVIALALRNKENKLGWWYWNCLEQKQLLPYTQKCFLAELWDGKWLKQGEHIWFIFKIIMKKKKRVTALLSVRRKKIQFCWK